MKRELSSVGKTLRRSLGVLGIVALSAGPMAAQAQGWYAGAGVGQADLDVLDESDTSMKIFVGHQFNPNFAVEFAYVDLGEAEANILGVDVTASADGFELTAVGLLPLANNFNLLGRVGFLNWDADYDAGALSGSESGTDLTFGVGVQYDMSNTVAFRAEYQMYDVDDEDVNNLGVSALFRF